MRYHIAANYQGYALAREIESQLTKAGIEVVWYGADDYDENDDYTVYTIRAAQAVVADEDNTVMSKGLVVGGTGAAEAIMANKVPGARAVHSHSEQVIQDARMHADANVLVIGANVLDADTALILLRSLAETPFSNNLDDARRIINVAEFENSGSIEGWMIDYMSGNSGPTILKGL